MSQYIIDKIEGKMRYDQTALYVLDDAIYGYKKNR